MKKINLLSKYKAIAIIFMGVWGIFMTSCEDDDKNFLNDFNKGGFVRFADPFPTVIGVNNPANLVVSFTLEAPDNNVVSYNIEVTAILSGTTVGPFPIGSEITTFPATINFTSQDFANALNVDVSDINFGDTFNFSAKAVNDEGIEYSGERIDFDDDTKVISGGNTTDDLLDEPGYRQAFTFGFVLLCPSVQLTNLVGTYDVTALGFGEFFGETDLVREVILGPGNNQITIIDGAYPVVGGEDLILDIDPNTGAIALAESAIAFSADQGAFDTDNYGSASGYVFSCIGDIAITLDFDTYGGNAHPFNLKKR